MTAEEIIEEMLYVTNDADEDEDDSVHDSIFNVKMAMIEFAKLKCKEMQEAIFNNINANFIYVVDDGVYLKEGIDYEVSVNRAIITEAYDINNIK